MGSHALHPLLTGIKARVTALHQHADRLYAGCADGSLRVYSLTEEDDGSPKLLETHQIGRRQIDQVGVLPEAKQLVILTDSTVSLHKLDNLMGKGCTTTLSQARTPHAFATTTYFAPSTSTAVDGSSTPGKVSRDLLVIGCRKKVLVYGAGRNLGEAWELSLPHSPRTVIFPAPFYADLPSTVHLLYSPQSSVLLHISTGPTSASRLTVTDLPTTGYPPVAGPSIAKSGQDAGGFGSAFTSFGGMLSKAAIPAGTRTVGGEVLLARDDLGVFFSSEGHFTRNESLQWPATPDTVAFGNPYIYSVLPPIAGTTPPLPTVRVYLAPTLALRSTVTFPAPSAGGLVVSAVNISSPPGAGSPSRPSGSPRVLLASTPTDKNLLHSEGSTVWEMRAGNVGDEVDELVREGRVADAIGLVEASGDAELASTQKLSHLRILQAVSQFARGEYKPAIETFIAQNVHPAKVVAMYPKQSISGNLYVPREDWMSLFGAVEGARLEPPEPPTPPETGTSVPKALFNAHLSLARKKSNETIRSVSSAAREDSSSTSEGPVVGKDVPGTSTEISRAAIDELIYFLSDRRQKLAGAIPALGKPLPSEADLVPLAELPAKEVHSLPDVPMTQLDAEQLLRTAQVVYTSLLKVYLVARPTLVGSLCRIENWCDVAEVEPLLREKGRIDDLRDLYMQKNMHDKALSMLYEQAQGEDDPLDRYPPTVRYLQKLGPSHLDLIFASAKWILREDPDRALQIFTADEPEVDALPRAKVTAFLELEHWPTAIKYLEHVIDLGERSPDLHDKLAELLLRNVREARGKDKAAEDEAMSKLLAFLGSSTQYRAYRILSQLRGDEMPRARALLQGRLGNHDAALRIYVYDLKDYKAAEAYCSAIYQREPDPKGIYLHLLKLYLAPTPVRRDSGTPRARSPPLSSSAWSSRPGSPPSATSTPPPSSRPGTHEPLIEPALALITKHGLRIDSDAIVNLLPPLIPVADVQTYLQKQLKATHSRLAAHRIQRELVKARNLQVKGMVLNLEVRRVRVDDQRVCPQCHKRLGQSAIAVHAPRGQVTHLHCKDQFSAFLNRQYQ